MALAATFAVGLAVGTSLDVVTASRGGQTGDALPAHLEAPGAQMTSQVAVLRPVYPAEVLRVIDGDTFEARVRLWPGLETVTKIRLRGIDAPELKARCDEERSKALAARDALQTILDQGDVGVSTVTLDKYGGRVVADTSTRATPDVSAALLGAGHARIYAGGRRESWCP
jgi:endonuclease YncB( thermonuclease family)